MMARIRVTDHAVLRYLERAHGLDVKAVRRHLAGRVANGARLGAVAVTIENVKLVLRRRAREVALTTAMKPGWPSGRSRDDSPAEAGGGDAPLHGGAVGGLVDRGGGAEAQDGAFQETASGAGLEAGSGGLLAGDETGHRVEVERDTVALAGGGDRHGDAQRTVVGTGSGRCDERGEGGGEKQAAHGNEDRRHRRPRQERRDG